MRFLLLVLVLLFGATALSTSAAQRTWRNSDGTRTFRAEYLASDGARVTLKRADGRIVTISMAKLHDKDQAWVRTQIDPKDLAADAPAPKGAAFDHLEFGDDRTTVEKKLKASKSVVGAVNETFFGRTGLNGVFKTKATIGGLHCYLFFDWTRGGSLKEVTLQTQPVNKGQYITSLRGNWTELIDLLDKLHGRPVQSAPFPMVEELQDGAILGSHLWYTDEGHSVILGTGQEGLGYNVVVRITSDLIRPVPVGADGSPVDPNASGPRPKPSDFQP